MYFGATLRWQCCGEVHREPYRNWRTIPGLRVGAQIIGNWSEDLSGVDESPISMLLRHWAEIMGEYTTSNLTFSPDRTVALQGVIKYFEAKTNHENLAGLWRPRLDEQILWLRVGSSGFAEKSSIVPSWSWLGMNVRVGFTEGLRYDLRPEKSKLGIIRFAQVTSRVDPKQSSILILNGELHIHGFLIPSEFLPTASPSSEPDRERYWQHFVSVEWTLDYELADKDKETFYLPIMGPNCYNPRCEALILVRSVKVMGAYERIGYAKIFPAGPRDAPWSKFEPQIIIIV